MSTEKIISEEMDLFLTRKLTDVLPNSIVKKRVIEGEKHPHYYLYVPGKEPFLLARGFNAVKQAVKLYRDNLVAEQQGK